MPWWEDRACPRCKITFERGSANGGWNGFQEHWIADHLSDRPFNLVWGGFCTRHKKYQTVLMETDELHDPIVLELYLLGGTAEIGSDNKPGKDRRIFERIADRVGVSEFERQLKVGDYYPFKSHHNAKFGLVYSVYVAIQHLKYRPYHGFDSPFVLYSGKRGIWELSKSGMEHGKRLSDTSNG